MVTNITISAGDTGSPKQGCPENFFITFLNGATVCYVSLSNNGVEETTYARNTINSTDATQWTMLIPQGYGSNYTVVAYSAITGGSVIGTSAAFTVTQSILPTALAGTLPFDGEAKISVIGDSTLAQCYTQETGYDGSTNEHRWMGIVPKLMGYPADFTIWPNYHLLTPTNTERFSGGGAFYGVAGDSTQPVGTSPGTSSWPGYITRMYPILMMRPQLLIVVVTINDLIQSISNATTIANYQTIANIFTLAGIPVLFQMMRPCGITGGNLTARVTINNGIANIVANTAGCSFVDFSPVYTKVAGGQSSYNDPGQVNDGTLSIGIHPTPQGGIAEANSFITQEASLGFFSTTANRSLAVYTNAEGYNSYTTAPNFNSGNNAGVTLSNGASGTYLVGINAVSGGGASATTVVGSTETNSGTGGMSQVLTITPGGTGAQVISVTMAGITRSSPYTGYQGNADSMMRVDITSDPQQLINCMSLGLEGYYGSPVRTYFYDGTTSMASDPSNTPLPLSATQTWWFYCPAHLDNLITTLAARLIINVDATSRTSAATVKIKQQYLREHPASRRTKWILPAAPTLSQNGPLTGGNLPLIVTFASSGVKASGLRWYYRTSTTNTGWTLGGDVYLNPNTNQYSFIVTGLTVGTSYDFRVHALRYGNVLGAGYGLYHAESEPSNYLTLTPSSASAIGNAKGLIIIN